MSVASLLSETDKAAIASVRARAGVSLDFAAADTGVTRLAHLEERGGFRAKFPRPEHGCEAVTINTGGGMLGGDRYRFDVAVGARGNALVSSQSAERVYRALDGPTHVEVRLRADAGATVLWVPQETILFSGARLARRIEADIAADATLLIVESMVFGREAHGENVRTGTLRDTWRIRRAGELIYADAVRLDGDMHASLQEKAVGNGARASATVLYIAPDAEDRRDAARNSLGEPRGRAALSAWNGMLAARFLAPDSATLRADIYRLTEYLMHRPMPRVWAIERS
jgi:urease accessory protein